MQLGRELSSKNNEDGHINLTLEMPSLSIHLLIWYQGAEAPLYMHACCYSDATEQVFTVTVA